MFKHQSIALVFAAMCMNQALAAATPVYKCFSKGTVVYQSDPCPSNVRRSEPNINQLNAERMKKRLEDDGSTKTEKTATVAPASSEKNQVRQTMTPVTATVSSFRCDGRKHCSQMTSCSEAKYFLNNCPGVKMDGDKDGIPCEEQWCKSPLH